MKILYISASILPSQYANSVHVMKMCNALSKNGHKVTLFGTKGEGKEENLYQFYNVENTFQIQLVTPGKFMLFRKVWNILKLSKEYELIYTRYTLAAFLCACFLRKQVIYEYHGVMDSAINAWMEKILSKAEQVRHVFITESLQKAYQKKNPSLDEKKCMVLSDCADNPQSVVEKNDRKQMTCGYIGSFQSGKGVELVLEMAKACPDTRFHIVGGKDPEILELKKQYPEKNIIWHGFVEQKKAMEILQKEIDIALLPNKKNVFVGKKGMTDIGAYTSPMKLFEYMSYGKAIIASRLPVLEEIIVDGQNAILADAENTKEWIEAFQKLQNSPELLKKIKKKAKEEFLAKYTWESRAKKAVDGLPAKKRRRNKWEK